jgi:hypothetical protein
MKNIFPNKQEKETLLTQLNLLGAKRVYVSFRGGGDEGQVEETYYRDVNDNTHEIPSDMIAWTKQAYGQQQAETKNETLVEVLEDLCYRALDETGWDWYNNDGGQGELIIDFTETPPKIDLSVGINTMSTEYHDYDLNESEEE